MPAGPLVLASTSEARRRLVQRLGLAVTCVAPTCDEAALHGHTPDQTALLRAFGKAESVWSALPTGAWVIGSDQLVDLDGRILGKPGTTERACAQLADLAGRTHRLVTAVVVLGPGVRESRIVVMRLTMRALGAAEIAAYVAADAPEACAGSYKIECGGRALFSQITSADPAGDESAIEGLPLVALSGMLAPHFDLGHFDAGPVPARGTGSPPPPSLAP
jgi:septum formation protein